MAGQVKGLRDDKHDRHAHHTEQLEVHPYLLAGMGIIAEGEQIAGIGLGAGG